MNIFETLRLEHAAAEAMLDEVEAAKSNEALHDLKIHLLAHNRAEEAVTYELLDRLEGRHDMDEIKTREHHLVEDLLEELERTSPSDPQWFERLDLLRRTMTEHIQEEETAVFAVIQQVISDNECEMFAQQFQVLREDVAEVVRYQPYERSPNKQTEISY